MGVVLVKRPASSIVKDAVRWIERNKDEWLEVQRVCCILENVRDWNGRPRYSSVTRGSIYMLAQLEGIEITNTKTFKRDHDLWSVLSRYLTDLHPQLERVIRHRECDVAKYVRVHGLPKLKSKYIYKQPKAA